MGESLPSEALSIRTDGEAPGAAPGALHALGVGPRAVRVTWAPPPPETWNGPLLGYYVGHKKEG